MLISPAYAQDAASMMAGAQQFLPLLLIFGVFYFLLIRPQQQRARDTKTMLAALKRGDRVVTGGGIIGTVARVREGSDEVEVDLGPAMRVTVLRDSITQRRADGAGAVVANDSKPASTKAS